MEATNFDKAFADLLLLVERYSADKSKYLEPNYNESSCRKDFIDKFFIALGWDVNHDHQTNPYEQEVKVEKSVSVAARVKKADYAFFLAPNFSQERFFVEAKRPSAILNTPDNCFQTIRYAFSSAKAALSILTNFNELYVIDCRFRPDIQTAANHIHKKFSFEDFRDRDKFGEIYYLFGRDAVEDGALERYAETLPKPKGKVVQRRLFGENYQEIDDAFLVQLEVYREELAKMFKRKNTQLDSDSLTEAVQRTLDRLVFIRFLEDKLIEPSTILDKLGDDPQPWKKFVAKCREFDKTYNGIIFKEHPVIDREDFVVDNTVFTDITDSLADKYSPYHFNYIPIHILGSIYERFLGSVIVATAKRATVKLKPEVRKAGGVFYTPQYIVKYIVENTIGELLKGKTPADVAKMRFADIACGSGSFLLGAYEYLLAWHTKYYNEKASKKEAKEAGCITNDDGTYALSFEQKKEILVNNIYGIDIDRQAYEVTQLSLFLKLLEDETQGTKQQFLTGHRESLLPDLRSNIVCGNALVDWDITGGDLFEQIDHDKQIKLNPMSFEQKFPEIMRNGGFDAIIGNPPYIRIQGFEKKQIEYFIKKYESAQGNFDIYVNFVERAFSLLKPDGRFGQIVPNKFFRTDYGIGLRSFLSKDKWINRIVDFGASQVFSVTIYTCLLFLKNNPSSSFEYSLVDAGPNSLDTVKFMELRSDNLDETGWVFAEDNVLNLLKKLEIDSTRLLDLPATMNRGSSSGCDDVFMIGAGMDGIEPGILRSPIFATDFNRYQFYENNKWKIIFPYKITDNGYEVMDQKVLATQYPLTYEYLKKHKATLEKRKGYQIWYAYSAPRSLNLHEYADILVPLLADKGLFALIPNKLSRNLCPMASGGFTITLGKQSGLRREYLLGLLNSKLLFWKLRHLSNVFRGGWITCTKQYIGELPIRSITNADEKAMHDLIVHSVEQIMEAKQKLVAAATDRDRDFWQNKCDVLERSIDDTVYKLYNLTPDEIKLVESA